MSQSVFVLLHMRYRPSVIFPVAFRELLFCFVSNEVEFTVAYDCLLTNLTRISTELSRQRSGAPTTLSS